VSPGFDYVVVGAGSAGCALARRLSDHPDLTVGLIEAGGTDEHPDISEPTAYFRLWGTDVDWAYESEPQPGTNRRVHKMPRGRVLGGTSSINGMVYLRGASADYDSWAARGCAGWDWATVRPAFEAMEDMLVPAVVENHNPLSEIFIAAAEQAGYPVNPFFDSGTLDGVGWNRSTNAAGRRNSSYRAFLAPVARRANLSMILNTTVDRVLVDSRGAVSGVEVRPTHGAGSHRIHSANVVLCAGTFESPRLLLASGIGPADALQAVGIKPLIDLRVGENLIDHLLIGIVYTSKQPISLAHSMVTECCAFGRSDPQRDAPDVEISFAKEANFAPPSSDDLPRYTIIPGITQPRSRGNLRLRSDNPSDRPVIDPAYLSDAHDVRTLIDSIRMARKIGAAAAFNDWNAGEYFPGTAVESDADLTKYIRQSISTWFHPVGTCRMGVDSAAVVDPNLAVLGASGLHVADASVMPDIVSVNTNAAATMIGWRAGELVLV
jgi:choline dehydrogenase